MYKQKGIRCSDAPAKSTTGSMDKLAKGTSYSGAPPNSPAGIYFTYVTSDLEPYATKVFSSVEAFYSLSNYFDTKNKESFLMNAHNLTICFTHNSILSNIEGSTPRASNSQGFEPIGVTDHQRKDGFTYGLAEKRGKPLSLVIKRCSLFFFSRTHVNSVVVVHEKKYSLEELQTMVDDMDYGLRLTIRTVSRRVL
ncbi:hypothetical protein YC2023_017806 [Brassica napus]